MKSELDDLRSPQAIRRQSLKLFEAAKAGKTHFKYHPEQLKPLVDFVIEVIRKNYPDLNIPFHSRWRHFNVGGTDRVALLNKKCLSLSPVERACSKLDLAVVSVLLDAGAGESWKYTEDQTGKSFSRSEGLAIASFWLFMEGAFSDDPNRPHQVTAQGLLQLNAERLKSGFQVSPSNPLIGLEGRLTLLHSLGRALNDRPDLFAQTRPGGFLTCFQNQKISAVELLRMILDGLGPIWPGRILLDGVHLGDCWRHPLLGPLDQTSSLIPFHKLSQWLTYSLIEPIEEAGIQVTDVHELTGLPEYRNGGLLLDLGLLSLRDPADANLIHLPDSALIVEWRALTVISLDLIAKEVRSLLGFQEKDFPLAKVLEGGTWWAGRTAAQNKRSDGSPPLRIQSDGTLF